MSEFLKAAGAFLHTSTAQAVLWLTVLAILVAMGAFFVKWFRSGGRPQPTASDILTRFRDLHDKGELTTAEFRSIKSVLGPRIQDQIRSEDADRKV